MNVIEKIKEILQNFPKISEVCNEIHVDFTDTEPANYGLAPIGDELISEDVLGNQERQHSFMLYAVYSGINDYERLTNSGALLELSQYLDSLEEQAIDNGKIIKIRATNGMLYEIPEENCSDGMRYQLTIVATYTVEI